MILFIANPNFSGSSWKQTPKHTLCLRPLLRVAEGELMIIGREMAGDVLRCMSHLSPYSAHP
ncbi:hypothetical protein BCEP4_410041 [Burkholderia cepacia]|nr:hypothetical protein BCEP4_410041 [Burkholderia cepacia]